MSGVGVWAHLYKHIDIKKQVYTVFLLAGIGLLCGGCGETAREAMTKTPTAEVSEAGTAVEGETAPESVNQENQPEPYGSISENGLPDGEEDGETVQEDRPESVKVKGIYVSGPVAGIGKMDELIDLVDRTELNAMVIDVKNDEGKVTYKMQSGLVEELGTSVAYIPDIRELVKKCREKNIYLIARIVAFRDPYLAEKKPEWAVKTADGEAFRDKNGMAWVNPYKREIWDYLAEIALRAAEDGFDEVQFDYIRFSTDVAEEEVDYGPGAAEADKTETITDFTKYMYGKLAPEGVYVAADVFGTVIDNRTDQMLVGQDYRELAANLDYICPMVYPSHYYNGVYGIAVPDAEPYATIYAAASASVRELEKVPEEKRPHVRLWLQSFTAGWVPGHISYGPQQIREQIRGAYAAGCEEWILWNAAVNYQADSLLTPEDAEAERRQWEEEALAQEEGGAEKPEAGEGGTERPEAGEGGAEKSGQQCK